MKNIAFQLSHGIKIIEASCTNNIHTGEKAFAVAILFNSRWAHVLSLKKIFFSMKIMY